MCLQGVPAPAWGTGSLPCPVALANSLSRQHRSSRASPQLFPCSWRPGQAFRRVWSLAVSTDPWAVSVQQLQLVPVAWECQGDQEQPWTPQLESVSRQEEKGAGPGWWESHPAAPAQPGAPLPPLLFFPEVFLWLFKDNQEFCSTQFRPHCGRIPRVVSEPNCSSGLPSSCSVPWQREHPGFPLRSCCPATALPAQQFPVPASSPFVPPGCVCAGIPPGSLGIPTALCCFLSLLLSCNSLQENCVI